MELTSSVPIRPGPVRALADGLPAHRDRCDGPYCSPMSWRYPATTVATVWSSALKIGTMDSSLGLTVVVANAVIK